MKFGASTWLWTSPFTSDNIALLENIAALGFNFVELPVENPGDINPDQLKPVLQQLGLDVVICAAVTGERDLSSANPEIRRNALDYFTRCVKLAEALGSDCFAGPFYAQVGKPRLPTASLRQAEWDNAVNGLAALAKVAGDSGVRLGLEPLNRFETDMVNNVSDALRLIEDTGSPQLGISLDSFHMNIEETNFRAAIEQAGKRLVHLQVSDSHRGVPGDGNSDWAGLRAGLKAIGYDGRISIESFSPDASSLADAVCIWRPFTKTQDEFASRGLAFLQQWWAEA